MYKDFSAVKVGDVVVRVLAGSVRMPLKVTDVIDNLIVCGDWTFDRKTGLEEDSELEWGAKFGRSGSYLEDWSQSV